MSSNNKKEPPLVEVLKVLFYFLLIALIISALSACGGGANATAHIIEETDSTVGPHFVFLAHRDEDFNKGVQSDRQRNEIKTYDKSDSAVLGFEGETMQFDWYVYVSSDMWRGVSGEDFIRPKWGIYRSVAELDKLRGQEERVKFADFVIRKGTP